MKGEPVIREEVAPAVVKRHRRFPVVWVVPLVAAMVAAYLVYERVQQAGPRVTIRFKDGTGLRPGQSPVTYRGVIVGKVRSISLTPELDTVLVDVRLDQSAAGLAKEGSVFWIVRPELGIANITGLGTIITGPYIEVLPGNGEKKTSFEGADASPRKNDEKGLKLVLIALQRGSLQPGSPVYYRGIEVGSVQDHRLSADARMVELEVFIQQQYAPLVRNDSKFWNVSGVNVDFGLFKGAEVSVESLKSLVSGGVTFATPEEGKGEAVKDGALFRLYDEPEKEWLKWAPAIRIREKPASEADGN
jgi:paraquat-inducible protein B